MSLILSQSSQATYEPIEAGNHVARCIQVIDLGVQAEKAFESEEIKMNPKIRLVWELPNEIRSYKDKETGEEKQLPAIVGQEFKASLHEKSKLRKTLASWRGRDFTEEELQGFSLDKLLTIPCMINITHIDKGGKKYANITAVTPLAKGMTCPDQVTESLKFDIEDYTQAEWEKLPEFIQNKIKESTQFKHKPVENVPIQEPNYNEPPEIEDVDFEAIANGIPF